MGVIVQAWVGNSNLVMSTFNRSIHWNPYFITNVVFDLTFLLNSSPNFSTLSIKHDTNVLAGDFFRLLNVLHPAQVFWVVTMWEVEAENIRTRLNQLNDCIDISTCRTKGTYNLGFLHKWISPFAFMHQLRSAICIPHLHTCIIALFKIGVFIFCSKVRKKTLSSGNCFYFSSPSNFSVIEGQRYLPPEVRQAPAGWRERNSSTGC